jgi:hypothetical protein
MMDDLHSNDLLPEKSTATRGVTVTLAENLSDEITLNAFPTSPDTPPDLDGQLQCLSRLHQHYIKFFTAPEDSLTLGDWETPDDIARIEAAWNRYEEALARPALSDVPTTVEEFNEWFVEVAVENEYQEVCDYLRNDASLLDIALLVLAENNVDGRIDDLMSLVQIGAVGLPKMTIAKNYWDEMGNGEAAGVHTTMFNNTVQWMNAEVIQPSGFDLSRLEFAEAYANGCELLMYSLRRRYILRGLAGLGLLEASAPARFAATMDGCRRLGVPEYVSRYQELHVHVDAEHSREWIEGVFTPIAKSNPDVIPEFALGVLIRGNVAGRFFRKVHASLFGLG